MSPDAQAAAVLQFWFEETPPALHFARDAGLDAAIAADDLYVLPAFDDEGSRTFATAVATGRASGTNAYPPFVDAFLETLSTL